MKPGQYNALRDAVEAAVANFCMDEAVDLTEAREFARDYLTRGKVAHEGIGVPAHMRTLTQLEADSKELARLMEELLQLDSTPPGLLEGLKRLYDGVGDTAQQGSNDLTLADFGEAFTLALERRMNPNWAAYHKARSILRVYVESDEEFELMDGALQVGLQI